MGSRLNTFGLGRDGHKKSQGVVESRKMLV